MIVQRSGFKRPTPPPSLARVRQTDYSPRPRAPAVVPLIVRQVEPVEKEAPMRDEQYRRYVAGQICFGCGIGGLSQAAHPNFGKGLALKTDDRLCFPLCGPSPLRVGCHTQHDLCIDMERAERRKRELDYIAAMQVMARLDGWQV